MTEEIMPSRSRPLLLAPGMWKSASETRIENTEPTLPTQQPSAHSPESMSSYDSLKQGLGLPFEPRRFAIHSSRLGSSEPQSPHGMTRSHTAVSLEELSKEINSTAVKNIEAFLTSVQLSSREAMQQAQSSIQQTASNLEGNLQQLTTMLSQGLALPEGNGFKPLDHESGAIVPWGFQSQLHQTLRRARSTQSISGPDPVKDWMTKLEQSMQHLRSRSQEPAAARPSLRDPGRQVAIVTTAALPWMTGTSINPLLRAAYLASDKSRQVTLVVPWLSRVDQDRVFPNNMHFDTPEEQEAFVLDWARKRTGLDCNFKISWYPGRYGAEKGCILPVGDVTQCIPDTEADVAVLEEPEHLTWYHHGRRWTDKFKQVVGVMHTNYLDYVGREDLGFIKAFLLRPINAAFCRMHCHSVIKLSDAVQSVPRQHTLFVHGVSPAFLKVGAAKSGLQLDGKAPAAAPPADQPLPVQPLPQPQQQRQTQPSPSQPQQEQPQQQAPQTERFGKGAYFLSKVLWAKGYTELLDLMKQHSDRSGEVTPIDVYGWGPDLPDVQAAAEKKMLALKFNGAKDHADAQLHDYKVFINPSLSDVVATTTAEALAMGKFVVCADHPSNKFFERFPNCLVYKNSEEFSQCLQRALSSEPKPLTQEELHSLSWEAATERFLDVADISHKITPLEEALDRTLFTAFNTLLGHEKIRQAVGAGTNTRDMPARVTDYVPSQDDIGGFFDNHARALAQKAGK